jgi:hypothetical protein
MASPSVREWAARMGATLHEAAVEQPIPAMGGGFGIVAAEELPRGTVVARMPRALLVTAASARKACKLPPSVPAIDSIVVFLVTERLLARRDGSRPWAPWVSRLPDRYDNFIEIEDAVDGELVNRTHPNAGAQRRSEQDAAAVQAAVQRIMPVPRYRNKVLLELENFHALCDRLLTDPAQRHFVVLASSDASLVDSLDRATIRWGFNSLMSRGFGYSQETWAMMPWVDYFNYAIRPNVHPAETAGGGFEFKTVDRAIPAGEQLLLTYGVYSDVELAMWYGFTLCGAQHQRNCGYVLSPMADTDGEYPPGASWAVQLAERMGLPNVPSSWKPTRTTSLGKCVFGRAGCSQGFRTLIADLAAANDVTEAVCVRHLIDVELPTEEENQRTNDEPRQGDTSCLALVAWGRNVAEDTLDLLRYVGQHDDGWIECWLEEDM